MGKNALRLFSGGGILFVRIGFAMYGRWPAMAIPAYHEGPNRASTLFLRFMIDGRYQGRGFGRTGMQALLAQIKAQPDTSD